MSLTKDRIMPMLLSAIRGAEQLSPARKADVYEGIACTAEPVDQQLATEAQELAQALRNSEGLQRRFANLLTDHESQE